MKPTLTKYKVTFVLTCVRKRKRFKHRNQRICVRIRDRPATTIRLVHGDGWTDRSLSTEKVHFQELSGIQQSPHQEQM